MGEVGKYPMFEYIIKSVLGYLSHLNKSALNRPILAAAMDEDKMLPKHRSWYKRTDSLLNMSWYKVSDLNNDLIKKDFFVKIKRSFENFWKKEIGEYTDNSGKLSFYRKIKTHFEFEPYLNHIKLFKQRRCVTAMRISSHKLEVEVGRYTNKNQNYIERNKRYCMLCLENFHNYVVGDEIHAMMTCPVFQVHRNKLLRHFEKKYVRFSLLNNSDKCLFLLSSENDDINVVSKFIYHVLSYKRPRFHANCHPPL